MVILVAGMQNPASFVKDPGAKNENPVEIILANVTALKSDIRVAPDPVISQELRSQTIASHRPDQLANSRPPKYPASSYQPKSIANSRSPYAPPMNRS